MFLAGNKRVQSIKKLQRSQSLGKGRLKLLDVAGTTITGVQTISSPTHHNQPLHTNAYDLRWTWTRRIKASRTMTITATEIPTIQPIRAV